MKGKEKSIKQERNKAQESRNKEEDQVTRTISIVLSKWIEV
ncbi:MAG TPA: hypothetical protein VFV46_09440 [Lacibacter sp.]|nr:hypothetical protein [Lacibacter sp.]